MPDHQDSAKCIEVLMRELPAKLDLLGCGWQDLIVDFRGGTKAIKEASARRQAGRSRADCSRSR